MVVDVITIADHLRLTEQQTAGGTRLDSEILSTGIRRNHAIRPI